MKSFVLLSVLMMAAAPSFGARVNISSMKTLHDHETAAKAELAFDRDVSVESFKACSPQESRPFPSELSEELQSTIFISREMRDLRNCSRDSCPFNFTPDERELIGKQSSDAEIKKTFFQFYNERVSGEREIDIFFQKFLIQDARKAFSVCESKELDQLVKGRPLASWPFWLSAVRYDGQMRPTTRLTQGKHFVTGNEQCFAEALVFSNHYDVELIKVWSFLPKERKLTVEVRHRVDFLTTWFRRLQKPRLQSALEEALESEVRQFLACLPS
ncbi:MAG: hypothetical protein EA369_00590 [Bradymonadales bacterium]|nr:MAG: hypothetical protein EA369_00590 [Bradymonadales bacterium]